MTSVASRLRPSMLRAAAIACALVVVAAPAAHAAKKDPDRLPVTRVKDLHYGDVLFYFYQSENFEALTRLAAFDAWGRIPNHDAEAELLLGGLYLELGLHNEAGRRFETLLTRDIPQGVRNRAWFYLSKVWYARGYLDRAEQAIRRVEGRLPSALEAERTHLFANVLMRQGRFAEAASVLDAWRGPEDWTAFARFNLGVALVRDGRLDQAERFLTEVGTLETRRRELLALRDRANLALGYALLQAEQPEKARTALERVRLDGPYSNKALLGAGWASAQLGDYRAALTPWLELRDRDLLDAAVQESYLAIPYAFAKLEANAQAAEYYETALKSFEQETQQIDASVERIRGGTLLRTILEREATGGSFGWFWQLREVPDAPETRYLYSVLAGHDFQEGLKNYRDMAFLSNRLERWNENFDAYRDMLDTRQRAFAERLPRADALLAQNGADVLRGQRNDAESRLNDIEREGDIVALGNDEQREQWDRILRVERALADAPPGPETEAARERVRLVKGALQWRLAEAYRGRVFEERRDLRALDGLLRETQNRWERLQRARASVPENTGEFSARIDAARLRLDALEQRLVAARVKQSDFLAQLAINALNGQRERLNTYQLQARFSLATIYDRAANVPVPAREAAPAADAPPASETPAAGDAAPTGDAGSATTPAPPTLQAEGPPAGGATP